MSKLFAIFAALAAVPALAQPVQTPVARVQYDAFTAFDGTNGAGGFNYGYTNSAALTSFDTAGSGPGSLCVFGTSSTCLYASSSPDGVIPQASIGGSHPTVDVLTNAVIVHPGNSADRSVYGAFTATEDGDYAYKIDLKSVGHDTTNGTGYTTFTEFGGVVTLGTRGTLPTYLSSKVLTGTTTLFTGQSFGVIIDDNGAYGGDSTSLNFHIATVPEPATWGLMLAGFGMVGFAARRRQSVVAA